MNSDQEPRITMNQPSLRQQSILSNHPVLYTPWPLRHTMPLFFCHFSNCRQMHKVAGFASSSCALLTMPSTTEMQKIGLRCSDAVTEGPKCALPPYLSSVLIDMFADIRPADSTAMHKSSVQQLVCAWPPLRWHTNEMWHGTH